MKNIKYWIGLFLGLLIVPLWGNQNEEITTLSDQYFLRCGDCVVTYQKIFQKEALQDLVKLESDILPIVKAAEFLEDWAVLARLYPRLRLVYNRQGDIANTIRMGLKCLALPDDFLSKEIRAKENGALSELYGKIGIRDEAYKHHLEALKAVEGTDNLVLKFRILYQSGSMFYYMEKYDESIDFYQKSLNLARATEELNNRIDFVMGGLISAYFAKGEYAAAKFHLKQQLLDPLPRTVEAHAYQQLGELFQKQIEIDSAQYYYEEALNIYQAVSADFNVAEIKLQLGLLELEQNQVKEAVGLFSYLLEEGNTNTQEQKSSAHEGLAKAYGRLGQYAKAYSHQEAFSLAQPSLFQDSSALKVDKVRMEYLLDEQAHDVVQKEKEIAQMNRERLFVIVAASILLVFLLLMIWLFRQKQTAHKLTIDQNLQIENQNSVLTEYNQRLKSFNSVVSHDLKQPLRTTVSMLGLFKRRYYDGLPEDGKDYLNISDRSLKQMYKLIEGLLKLTELEKPSEKDMEWVGISSSLVDAQSQLQVLIQEKNAEVIVSPDLDQWPNMYAFEATVTQLWQNLISNAIKFTPEDRNPRIEIHCIEQRDHYLFTIKDNGIGIAKEYQEKIFGMFNRLNGRNDYEGSGIGLATCKRIVDMHDGKIWVESNNTEENIGSTFFFTLAKQDRNAALESDELLEKTY